LPVQMHGVFAKVVLVRAKGALVWVRGCMG
jgi:hypothetical protein